MTWNMQNILISSSLSLSVFSSSRNLFSLAKIYGGSYDDISRMGLTDWNKIEEKSPLSYRLLSLSIYDW